MAMGFGPDLSFVWNTLLHSRHVMSILLIFDGFSNIIQIIGSIFLGHFLVLDWNVFHPLLHP